MAINLHRRRSAVLLSMVALSLGLAACGNSAPAAESTSASPSASPSPADTHNALPIATLESGLKANREYKIAVLFPNAGDPYFLQKSYGYRDEAAKVGVKLEFFDAGSFANIEKQISQIENVTQRKFDAIAISVTSSTATVPALEAAVKAGVVVVGDGIFPNSALVLKRGEDSELAGYNAGKYLCSSVKDGTVGLLLGPPGIDLARIREAGVLRALSACPKVKIAKSLHNLSDLPNSMKAAENVLQSDPNVKGFYAYNSVVAQAIVQSLKSAGKAAGDVQVTTVDLDPDLEAMMKQGWLQETSVAGSVLLGRVVVDTIVQKLNGETVLPEAYLVPREITKDNLLGFDRSILYPPAGS
jgi:ribose transport system substrate-binding protein